MSKETIIVKTQKQFDDISVDYDGVIDIVGDKEWLDISARPNATMSVYDNATIQYVSGNATIQYVSGNATIQYVSGYASINLITAEAQVNCFGQNVVRYFEDEKNIKLKVSKSTTAVILERFKPTFESYKTNYPVVVKGKKAIFYKAVHKKDGKYVSDYSSSFTYEIGKKKTETPNLSVKESCTAGIHISPLYWAVNFGKHWDDMAILECEVPIDKIIVAEDSDGKVRTSELKVLREVQESEY